MRVALVTCLNIPEPDLDEDRLLAALCAGGIDARTLAWDDPAARPAEFDLCVLRSTWNYYRAPEAFLDWIERTDRTARLLNPAPIVRWNAHKRYLNELDARGVPTIPTECVGRGAPAMLRDIAARRGWTDVVVKPAISAASFLTHRFRHDDFASGETFLAAQLGRRDMLVQPYLPAVENGGERAVVCMDGEPTHAVCKSPRFADGDESVSTGLPVADDERELARRALEVVAGTLLYGRVDLIRDADGSLWVSELELIEPSLFLQQSPAAMGRFVDAIRRRLP